MDLKKVSSATASTGEGMTTPAPLSRNRQWKFLAQWIGLNILGWVMGISLVIFVHTLLVFKFDIFRPTGYSFSIYSMLLCLLFGASLGLWQWFKLRKFRIPILKWLLYSALGWGIGVGFLTILPNLIPIGDIVGVIGGAIFCGIIVGTFELVILRKFIAKPQQWVGAHILGIFITLAISIIVKVFLEHRSFLKQLVKRAIFSIPFSPDNFLLNEYLLGVFYTWMKEIPIVFLLIVAALSLSALTGWVLLSQSDIASPAPGQPEK